MKRKKKFFFPFPNQRGGKTEEEAGKEKKYWRGKIRKNLSWDGGTKKKKVEEQKNVGEGKTISFLIEGGGEGTQRYK